MGLEMWMTSCPEAMGWGFCVIFEKKQLVEIRTWAKRVDFRIWTRPSHLVGLDGTVTIEKIVSISPRVKKPKSQEGSKSFVPEQRESSVFRVFRDSYERFTYPYISHIRIMAILHLR